MNIRRLAVAAAVAVVLLCAPAEAQTERTIKAGTWVGCVTKEQKSELTGYLVDGDRAAFESAATRYILEGRCTIFETGERVFVVDTAIFSGLVKVRRRGETRSYWTNTEAV